MISESFLLQLPEIPMKMVLDNLDFPAIISLRKTCVDLRNTIEDLKPGPSDLQFVIQLKKDTVDFLLRWPIPQKPEDSKWKPNRQGCQVLASEDTLHLIYEKKAGNFWRETSCQVTCELPDIAVPVKTKILKSSNYLEVFCNDLKAIMEHQKSTVIFKQFILIADKDCEKKTRELYENLKTIFEHRKLKIQDLRLHTFGDHGIFSILPYLDSETLEAITIKNAVDMNNQEKLERINELMSMEQVKKSKNLLIFGFSSALKVQDYFHFTSFGITVPSISTRDIVALKDNMLAGSALQTASINWQTMEDNWQILNDQLGRNRMVADPEFPMGAVWEVPIPREQDWAILIMFNDGHVSFQKLKIAVSMAPEIPQNPPENLAALEIGEGLFRRPDDNPGPNLMFGGGNPRNPENPENNGGFFGRGNPGPGVMFGGQNPRNLENQNPENIGGMFGRQIPEAVFGGRIVNVVVPENEEDDDL